MTQIYVTWAQRVDLIRYTDFLFARISIRSHLLRGNLSHTWFFLTHAAW